MLYHYTDFAAFDGIIRCAELRLNNILNMNDASEMRLFMNGICTAVIERLSLDNEYDKIRKAEAFFQKELAVHESLMQQMVSGIACLQEVYYQADMREHPLVNEFYQTIKNSKKFSDRLSQIQNMMNNAWVQSAAFKHPSFASEREFRLVVSPFISNEFAVEPKYHVTMDRIKKYYPLDLNRMCGKLNMHLTDLVGEIIIGPTSSQSLPILQDYLSDCGLNVLKDRISLSECPLRKPTS